MSKLGKKSSEAAAKKAIYAELQNKYSAELGKIYELCFGKDYLDESEREKFVLELDQVVSGYRQRIDEKDYFERVKKCRADLSQVAILLSSSMETLARLDYNHLSTLMEALDKIAPNTYQKDFLGLFSQLANSNTLASHLDAALYLVTGYDLQEGRGRRHLPYLFLTMELIEFWERWTASFVPSTKGDKGQANTKAAEFVRLGLKMADPKATSSQAITSVNAALKVKKQTNKIYARLAGHPGSFRKVLRIIKQENLAGKIPKKT